MDSFNFMLYDVPDFLESKFELIVNCKDFQIIFHHYLRKHLSNNQTRRCTFLLSKFIEELKLEVRNFLNDLYNLDLIEKINLPENVIDIIRNNLRTFIINSSTYQRYLKFLKVLGNYTRDNMIPSTPSILPVPPVPSESFSLDLLNHYKSYLKILIEDRDQLLDRFGFGVSMREWRHYLDKDKYLTKREHNEIRNGININFKNFKNLGN